MVKKYLSLGALCLILAQCSKQPGHNNSQRSTRSTVPMFSELEARHSDIPIPIKHSPVTKSLSHNALVYDVPKSRADMIKFYTLEMERMGWHNTQLFIDEDAPYAEALLMFEKLHKVCSVSIRPIRVGDKPRSHITVLIAQRRQVEGLYKNNKPPLDTN